MFKVGDKVYLVKEILDYEYSWTSEMSEAIDLFKGQKITISYISESLNMVRFKEDEYDFVWPEEAFTRIKRLPLKKRVEAKIKTLWNESNYVQNNPNAAY